MDAQEVIGLSAAAVSASDETALVNTLDASINAIKSVEGKKRRIVGLQGRTANTGIVVGRIDGKPVITADMALLNAADQIIPLDIPIPVGQEVAFASKSSSGTAACALNVLVKWD